MDGDGGGVAAAAVPAASLADDEVLFWLLDAEDAIIVDDAWGGAGVSVFTFHLHPSASLHFSLTNWRMGNWRKKEIGETRTWGNGEVSNYLDRV